MKNELRIGNWVNWNGENGVVSQILEHEVVFKCGEDTLISELKPIELTEEILLKCGFKKLGSVFCISERCVVDTSENRISFYIDRIEEDVDLDLPKHLHSIQNLYYALCNEELNIKP